MVQHPDEGGVVAYSGEVHRLAEVRGQLRVGDSVEEFPDANVDVLTRAEFAAQVGMVLGLFEPISGHVLIGFEWGLEGFGREFTVHVYERLGLTLVKSHAFEKGVGFGLDLGVEGEAVGDFVIFVLVRSAFGGLFLLGLFGLGV